MLCGDGTRLVLKAAGRKNECSCTGRRRNAYTILCPQTWISLDGDVRWERHILNTCFHMCIFSFWRHFALLHALCPHSALTSFPSHAKPVSPLMKSVVVPSAERPGGSGAHVHVLGLKKTGHASACGSTGDWSSREAPILRPDLPLRHGERSVSANFLHAAVCRRFLSHSSSCHQSQWEFGRGIQDGLSRERN